MAPAAIVFFMMATSLMALVDARDSGASHARLKLKFGHDALHILNGCLATWRNCVVKENARPVTSTADSSKRSKSDEREARSSTDFVQRTAGLKRMFSTAGSTSHSAATSAMAAICHGGQCRWSARPVRLDSIQTWTCARA